jgi:hypothetical protein
MPWVKKTTRWIDYATGKFTDDGKGHKIDVQVYPTLKEWRLWWNANRFPYNWENIDDIWKKIAAPPSSLFIKD